MKKLIFALAILTALVIASCNNIDSEDATLENGGLINVEYSKDLTSVTLYLQGGVPNTEAKRALTRNMAMTGTDFFEVVFSNGTTTARTSWEIGQSAAISGVPHDTYVMSGTPVSATGNNAVLFAGRKTDKTLLAVGQISGILQDDGNPPTPAGQINNHSVSVTFSLAALTAAANLTQTSSSFTVSGVTGPDYVRSTVPCYVLTDDTAHTVTYTLGSSGTIANYLNGIYVTGTGSAELKIPRLAQGGGSYLDLPGPYADATAVVTAPAAGALSGASAIVITVTPTPVTSPATNHGVTSLTFSIPVNSLNNAAGVGSVAPINWYIRHGFGTNLFDLDDGTGNAGGSLLLSVGPLIEYLQINTTWQ